jgi:hypothetical protein
VANSPQLVSNRIDVPDSLDEINELFYRRGWTDGLPIIPPTEERVAQMLSGTSRNPQDTLGAMPPRWAEVTVEKIAINAVMAGCLESYMPVVITAIEALLEPEFNLYAIQATTHPVAPLLLINGPIRKQLWANSGYNVFGQGTRFNAVIGRAIRLVLINIGGGIHGKLDRATHGQPSKYSFCIAENEEQSPWPPFHVDRGFAPSVSTVTVGGFENPYNINDHSSDDAIGLLTTIAGSMTHQGSNNILYQYAQGEIMVVIGPEHGATIANSGYSKADVRKYLFENARVPKDAFSERHQKERFTSFIPGDLIPVATNEERILIVVAGGAGKHSMCCPSFGMTCSVTKEIRP